MHILCGETTPQLWRTLTRESSLSVQHEAKPTGSAVQCFALQCSEQGGNVGVLGQFRVAEEDRQSGICQR
jgi:hypothetical protein